MNVALRATDSPNNVLLNSEIWNGSLIKAKEPSLPYTFQYLSTCVLFCLVWFYPLFNGISSNVSYLAPKSSL